MVVVRVFVVLHCARNRQAAILRVSAGSFAIVVGSSKHVDVCIVLDEKVCVLSSSRDSIIIRNWHENGLQTILGSRCHFNLVPSRKTETLNLTQVRIDPRRFVEATSFLLATSTLPRREHAQGSELFVNSNPRPPRQSTRKWLSPRR